jgi:hypothetical protein
VNVICSIERIPWHDGEAGERCFGINISAAYDLARVACDLGQASADLDKVLPWNWIKFDSNRQWPIDVWTLAKDQTVPPQLTQPPGNTITLPSLNDQEMAAIEDVKVAAKRSAPEFSGTLMTWPNGNVSDSGTQSYTGNSTPRLCDRLAELSTAPYPIPQELRLAACFKVSLSDHGPNPIDSIFAAPRLPGGPQNTHASTDSQDQPQTWITEYQGNGIIYRVYCRPCPVADPNIDPETVDWKTGWLKLSRFSQSSNRGNWIVPLQGRLYDAFDLSQRFIEVLRHVQRNSDLQADPPESYARAAVAALGEMLNPVPRNQPTDSLSPFYNDLMFAKLSLNEDGIEKPLEIQNAMAIWTLSPICEIGTAFVTWETVLGNVFPGYASPVCSNFDLSPLGAAAFAEQLQHLHDLCLNPDNVGRLLVAQWDAAIRSNGSTSLQQWWQNFQTTVANRMAGISPLQILQRHYYRLHGFDLKDKLTSGALSQVPVCDRDDSLPREIQGLPAVVSMELAKQCKLYLHQSMPPTLKAWLPKYIEQFRRSLRPAGVSASGAVDRSPNTDANAPDDSPTQTAQPLLMQVMDFTGDKPTADASDLTDLFRHITGIGVVLSIDVQGPVADRKRIWRHLNLGRPFVSNLKIPVCDLNERSNVLVTCRPCYIDGLRQAMLSYDNHPLSSDSHPFAQRSALNATGPTTASNWPRLRYLPPDYSENSFAPMPYLTFGLAYKCMAYVRCNSGALPKELADVHPAKPSKLFEIGDNQVTTYSARLEYLRRVPVGSPQVHNTEWNKSNGSGSLLLPAIPKTVTPLARELGVTGLALNTSSGFYFSEGLGTLSLIAPAADKTRVCRVTIAGLRMAARVKNVPACSWSPPAGGLRVSLCDSFQLNQVDAPQGVRPVTLDLMYGFDVNTRAFSLSVTPYVGATAPYNPADLPRTLVHSMDPIRVARDGSFTVLLELETNSTGQVRRVSLWLRQPDGQLATLMDTTVCTNFSIDPTKSWGIIVEPLRSLPTLVFVPPAATLDGNPIPSDTAPPPPLVMLTPFTTLGRKSFSIRIDAPSSEPMTWDRWAAGDPRFDRGRREAALAGAYKSMDNQPALGEQGGDVNLPQDAAVAGFVLIDKFPLRTTDGDARPTSDCVDWSNTPVRGTDSWGPINMQMFIKEKSEAENHITDRAGADNAKSLAVNTGDVWEIRISVLVDTTLYQASHQPLNGTRRFVARLNRGLRMLERNGRTYYVMPPFRLLVEAAINYKWELPSSAGLWSAIQLQGPPNTATEVQARLDLDTAGLYELNSDRPSRSDEMIGRVEVLRQVWRPTGRPFDPFPFQIRESTVPEPLKPYILIDERLRWEAQGFADRHDYDHVMFSRLIRLDERKTLSDGNAPIIFREPIDRDLRALYYRIGLRAYSRYEGLVPATLVVTAAIPAFTADPSPTTSPSSFPTPWQRLMVPCRQPIAPLSQPHVRFVMPLTRTAQPMDGSAGRTAAQLQTPPLLVVLDERWHDQAGLAEELVVTIDHVSFPAPGLPKQHSNSAAFDEAGIDPISRGISASELLPPDSGVGFGPSDLAGPIGGTFDENTQFNPLFVTASFVVSSPRIPGWARPSLGSYFLKLRFRRRIEPEGYLHWQAGPKFSPKPGDSARLQLAGGARIISEGGGAIIFVHVDCAAVKQMNRSCFRLYAADSTGPARAANAVVRHIEGLDHPVISEITDPLCEGRLGFELQLPIGQGYDLRFLVSAAEPKEPDAPPPDSTAPPQVPGEAVPLHRHVVNVEVRPQHLNEVSGNNTDASVDPDELSGKWHCIDCAFWVLNNELVNVLFERVGGELAPPAVSVSCGPLIESPPTQAQWVLFAPAAAGDRMSYVNPAGINAEINWRGVQIDGKDKGLLLNHVLCDAAEDSSDGSGASRFAVLTREIQDASGAPGEQFVAVCKFTPSPICGPGQQLLELLPRSDNESTELITVGIEPGTSLRARIAALQIPLQSDLDAIRTTTVPRFTVSRFWDFIFDDKQPGGQAGTASSAPDAKARLVSWSFAIDLVPFQLSTVPVKASRVAR